MKLANKYFTLIISVTLLVNSFAPGIVWANEETPAAPETPVVETPVETPAEPVVEPPPEPVTENVSEPETPTEPVVTSETVISETTTEETPSSTDEVVDRVFAVPVADNDLTIRVNTAEIYGGAYVPGTEPVTVTDNTGTTHTVNANSVLAMLTTLDAQNENFAITDLQYYAAFDSFIINCVTVNGTPSCYNWQYTVNDVYPFVGIDDYILSPNDQVYLYFGNPTRFSVTDDTVPLNTPVEVKAEKYDYRNNIWVPRPNIHVGATVPNPADAWTPIVTTSTLTDGNGVANLFLTATGTVQIGIAEDYYYPTVAVTASLAQTNINLNIQTPDGEFFKQTVTVVACPQALESPVYTLNAWCAVEQAGAANGWTVRGNWFGSDVFLDSINSYASDFANNKFWSWYHDLNAGQTGLNGYILQGNEEILLTYGVNPLKLEASTPPPFTLVHDMVTVKISEQDFSDWSIFPAPWKTLTSSTTLYINGEPVELSNGSYSFELMNDQPYILKATKAGYAPSNEVRISGEHGSRETETGSTDSNSGSNNSGGGTVAKSFDVPAAVAYLYSQQKASGAIGSASLYSDWAAIALGSLGNSEAKNNLAAYLKTDPATGSTATDYERRAMALLALGVNPYSDTKTNYINKIIGTFDGTQFGDNGLVNDDIFALFPLLKAGYSTSDGEVQKAAAFIVSRQNSAGGWDSPDLTAAAVQALSQVKSLPGVTDALTKAKNYLKLSTKTDGRIGDNSFSTSWGLQALTALGESAESWNGTGPSPLTYLTNQQQTDGAVDPVAVSVDNRIWSTSYALPAVQGKTWSAMLNSVSKPSTVIIPTPGITTPTTTIVTPTTTIDFVTSTIPVTTTTPVIAAPEITEPIIAITEPTIVTIETTETNLPVTPRTTSVVTTAKTEEKPVEPETKTTPSEEFIVAPTSTPEASETKRLLEGAAAVAGTAGAYLAWRFIQNLA